jgi:hypothetical protein
MALFKSRIAVYRPSQGNWYFHGREDVHWGKAHGDDIPVPGSYQEEGRTELVVWRREEGKWYSHGGPGVQWGQEGDIPVPADYLGTGKAQRAVWRPDEAKWYIEGGPHVQWGQEGDIPVPADYLGTGKAQLAVYRPSDGWWYFYEHKELNCQFGEAGGSDFPVPFDYGDEGKSQVAVWRPSKGEWFIKGAPSSIQWGTAGDIPIPAIYTPLVINGVLRIPAKQVIDTVVWLYSLYEAGKQAWDGLKKLANLIIEYLSKDPAPSPEEAPPRERGADWPGKVLDAVDDNRAWV